MCIRDRIKNLLFRTIHTWGSTRLLPSCSVSFVLYKSLVSFQYFFYTLILISSLWSLPTNYSCQAFRLQCCCFKVISPPIIFSVCSLFILFLTIKDLRVILKPIKTLVACRIFNVYHANMDSLSIKRNVTELYLMDSVIVDGSKV